MMATIITRTIWNRIQSTTLNVDSLEIDSINIPHVLTEC